MWPLRLFIPSCSRGPLAAFAVLLFALSCAAVPPPARAAATSGSDGCADILVIGARGSGERPAGSAGSLGTDVAARLAARVGTGATVATAGVDYPAADLSSATTRPDRYVASVASGVDALVRQVRDAADRCGPRGQRLVLVGYSQGAQVVGDAAGRLLPWAAQVDVVLFGDPRFSPSAAEARGSFSGARAGMLGARTALPPEIRAQSWCRSTDPVCQGPVGTNALGHMLYRTSETAKAVATLSTSLGLPGPATSVAPATPVSVPTDGRTTQAEVAPVPDAPPVPDPVPDGATQDAPSPAAGGPAPAPVAAAPIEWVPIVPWVERPAPAAAAKVRARSAFSFGRFVVVSRGVRARRSLKLGFALSEVATLRVRVRSAARGRARARIVIDRRYPDRLRAPLIVAAARGGLPGGRLRVTVDAIDRTDGHVLGTLVRTVG